MSKGENTWKLVWALAIVAVILFYIGIAISEFSVATKFVFFGLLTMFVGGCLAYWITDDG